MRIGLSFMLHTSRDWDRDYRPFLINYRLPVMTRYKRPSFICSGIGRSREDGFLSSTALVDALRQTHYSIRELVDDPPAIHTMLESLTGICAHFESVLEHVPAIPIVADIGGRDFGHASTSGHHRRQSPTPTGSYSTSSQRVSRSPSLTDAADMPAAPSTFPFLTLDSLPPPVSRAYFRSVYSRHHGASSSQPRLAYTPATVEGDRPKPKETGDSGASRGHHHCGS
ncbi:uncharacterized protein LOC109706730 isoform X2 [Ananas comosus]|nr:uncharacterized protein LOC109706730 isoform X2 [Ananas comosus]